MAQKAMKMADEQEWFPAVYARLSDEDSRSGVSLSIENQIDILTNFVKDNGWHKPLIFFDDDKTGTDFNRKGFQDMYAEAQKGTINVLVMKDTSRFGRNWVKSGQYFEAIEEMGVRFICIQEGLDTIDPKCPALKMLPFYFVFAEWHSETTSEKIRAVRTNNSKKGKYQAAIAPYGYLKDPNDKHKLIIDPMPASVVKRIFEMRLQKLSYGVILHTLNVEGVQSPGAYMHETGTKPNPASKDKQWTRDILHNMFRNPVYRGDTANGKQPVTSYKNHKRIIKSPSEWIIVENTHEPIVSREVWQKCNDLMGKNHIRKTKDNKIAPFAGYLRCADCGEVMHQNHSRYTLRTTGEEKRCDAYNCSLHSASGSTACSSHYISLAQLNALVSADIRAKAGEILQDEQAARELFFAMKSENDGAQMKADKAALKKAEKRVKELVKLKKAAFEKSVLEDDSEMYDEMVSGYETERKELLVKVEELTATIEKYSQAENDVETFVTLLKENINSTELDRELVVDLIDHITVGAVGTNPREITIYYNFVGNI